MNITSNLVTDPKSYNKTVIDIYFGRHNKDFYCTVNVLKFSTTFLFLFTNKMLVIRAVIHKMFARMAKREDPGQTASSPGSSLFTYM